MAPPTGGAGGPDVDVAVLGAGPAGLGAAVWLARKGVRVAVLEREDHVGGLSASFDVAGVRVDHGSHRLHPTAAPHVMALLRELLGNELQTRPRRGRLRLFDRWVDFPLRSAQLARTLPPAFTARAAGSAVIAGLRPSRHSTFAEHVATGLGKVMGEEFWFPYARKVWGVDPGALSGEQARRRIRADTPGRLVAKVLTPPDATARTFLYPAGGFGRIAESLASAATTAGAALHLSSPVDAVRPCQGGGWRVEGATGVTARHVWSTLPVTVLARLLGLPAPRLEYRSMVLAYLVLAGGRYSPYDAHYLPSPRTPVTRISEPANYRDGDDPRDRTVLCAEIPCSAADPVWTAGDGEVGRIATDALTVSGLPPAAVTDVVVRRVTSAYPVYRLGYDRELAALTARLQAVPGVVTFGRQGLFAHDNTHHALAMAGAAVDCLDHGRFDTARWQRALSAFAEHVVED